MAKEDASAPKGDGVSELSLDSIRIVELDCKLDLDRLGASLEDLPIMVVPSVDQSQTEGAIFYRIKYRVSIGEPKEALFKLIVVYGVAFSCPTALEADVAQGAAATRAVMASYPFLRELVQTMTTRVGLPPLTLDVVEVPDHLSHPANPLTA